MLLILEGLSELVEVILKMKLGESNLKKLFGKKRLKKEL